MKTKFSALLKITEGNLDKIETEIAKNNALIETKRIECEAAMHEFYSLRVPQSGSCADLRIASETKQAALWRNDSLREEISVLKEIGKKLRLSHGAALVEHEKIKHLHQIETEKTLSSVKRKETKELDENATMRFFHKEKA